MNGLLINNIHTFNDLGMKMFKYADVTAKPKFLYGTFNGMNGSVNYSKFFGEMVYSDYSQSYLFDKQMSFDEYEDFKSYILKLFNGVEVEVVQDNDIFHKRIGEMTATTTYNRIEAVVTLTATYRPFKYRISPTIKTLSAGIHTIKNSQAPVIPLINASTTGMQIKFNDSSLYGLLEGDNDIDELFLKDGENTIDVRGEGTITLTYNEGLQ